MLPDAIELYDQYEAEQERIRRRRRREADEYESAEQQIEIILQEEVS